VGNMTHHLEEAGRASEVRGKAPTLLICRKLRPLGQKSPAGALRSARLRKEATESRLRRVALQPPLYEGAV